MGKSSARSECTRCSPGIAVSRAAAPVSRFRLASALLAAWNAASPRYAQVDEPLHTIGHGTRTVEELVALLAEAPADALVDARRFPGSHRSTSHAALASTPPGD